MPCIVRGRSKVAYGLLEVPCFLGFELMVLEGVREGERMLVSSWIHEFFDHRVAFSKKKKKGHTSIEFGVVLQDTRDLEQSPEVLLT